VFEKHIDRAKDIALFATAGVMLAFAGVLCLSAGAVWALSQWMPWPASLAVVGVALLAVAAISLWFGAHKKKPDPLPDPLADVDPASMIMGLMDLPVEVTKKVFSERPVASVVVIAGLGLFIASKPEVALKVLDKVVATFARTDA